MGTESLYVNGFNSVNEQWTETGASPWLNDNTVNYIETSSDEAWHEEFTFSDHSGSETLNSATLYVEVRGNSGRNDYVVIDIYDGSSWSNVASLDPDNDVYQWFNYDVDTILDSWVKVNAARLRVQYQRSGSPAVKTIYIRRAYIYVDYSVAEIPVLIQDAVSVTDSIGKERRLTVSDSVGVSDGLPQTDKTLFIIDSASLAEAVLKSRIVQPVLDGVSLADIVLKIREVAAVQDSVELGDSVTRDKAAIRVSDSVSLADSTALLRNLHVLDSVESVDDVSISYGATQVYVYDAVHVSDGVFKERVLSIQESLSLSDSVYKERNLKPVQDAVNLLDSVLSDKPAVLVGDLVTLVDGVRGDKTLTVVDMVNLSENIVKHVEGTGWSGIIIGISNPAKIMVVPRDVIKRVLGVES